SWTALPLVTLFGDAFQIVAARSDVHTARPAAATRARGATAAADGAPDSPAAPRATNAYATGRAGAAAPVAPGFASSAETTRTGITTAAPRGARPRARPQPAGSPCRVGEIATATTQSGRALSSGAANRERPVPGVCAQTALWKFVVGKRAPSAQSSRRQKGEPPGRLLGQSARHAPHRKHQAYQFLDAATRARSPTL